MLVRRTKSGPTGLGWELAECWTARQVSDPNKKNRWAAIPLLLFQVFVIRPVLIRQMKRDGEPGSAD